MTCTWCKNEATEGGRLPQNAKGKDYWPACSAHAYLIKSLKLDPIPLSEIELVIRKEQKAKEKAIK